MTQVSHTELLFSIIFNGGNLLVACSSMVSYAVGVNGTCESFSGRQELFALKEVS